MKREVSLPSLHSGQLQAWKGRSRFNALRCGRRWGKTQAAICMAGESAIRGQYIGIFAPDYKIMSETYRELEHILLPVTEHSNKTDGLIRLIGGGRIDFWTLNNPKAGRSRKYHGVLVDEAAFAGDDMPDIWDKAIEPTLFDYEGWAWALSTPNGNNPDNWFYQICTDKKLGWVEYHAPSNTNPYLSEAEFERIKSRKAPMVFQQEYLAEFVDWNGHALFKEQYLLVEGKPVAYPVMASYVYAVIDTALKDGLEHDGTAVIYFAKSTLVDHPLIILDWDVQQIEGAMLEEWLPSVQRRLDELAKATRATYGSSGIWIEDKASGIVLIQKAQKDGMEVEALPSDLTALGKEGRAMNASGPVYRGDVKCSEYAYTKTISYKGDERNHMLHQVCGFHIGQKDKVPKDLLDCFTYGVAIGLGNSDGF